MGHWVWDAASVLRLRIQLDADRVRLLFTVVAEFASSLDSRGPTARRPRRYAILYSIYRQPYLAMREELAQPARFGEEQE